MSIFRFIRKMCSLECSEYSHVAFEEPAGRSGFFERGLCGDDKDLGFAKLSKEVEERESHPSAPKLIVM